MVSNNIIAFLNQKPGRHTWFLEIDLLRKVCVCVCVSALRLVITSGLMWHDMDPYDWLNK